MHGHESQPNSGTKQFKCEEQLKASLGHGVDIDEADSGT